MGKLYGLSFVSTLVTAIALSCAIKLANSFCSHAAPQPGLISALFVWIGFVMPVQFTNQIFDEKRWGLFAIDTGYQLVSLAVMGTITSLFK